jgi:hypothetical protein
VSSDPFAYLPKMTSPATHSFMPNLGEYVVLQLDPVATLASLEDEATTAATRLISTKKYIGYCGEMRATPAFEHVNLLTLGCGYSGS